MFKHGLWMLNELFLCNKKNECLEGGGSEYVNESRVKKKFENLKNVKLNLLIKNSN
jgi:hypothetical protein